MRNVASYFFAFASGFPLFLATEAVGGLMAWLVFAVGILVIGFIATIIYPPQPIHFGLWHRDS